jgi:hypothetical protein
MRLISPTYVPSDPTPSIWWPDVDKGAPGRGKHWDSSLWTHGIVDLRWEVPTGMQFLFRTSSFTAAHDDDLNKKSGARRRSWAPGSTIRREVHDDDLEHLTHEQEARCTTMIGFEFLRSLKNSATTFRATVRQPATTDSIDGLTRPPIGTSSTTTRLFGLALTKIQTMKPKE